MRRHDRDEQRALVKRVGEPVERHEAVRLDRQVDDREPLALQRGGAFEHAFVLGRQDDDVVAVGWRPACGWARAKCAAPLIARLLASVAPEVKTISRGSAPISRGDLVARLSTAAAASLP